MASAAGCCKRSRSSSAGRRPTRPCSRIEASPEPSDHLAGAIGRRNNFHGKVRRPVEKRPHAAGRNSFAADEGDIRAANGIGVARYAKARLHRHQTEFPGPHEFSQNCGNVQHDTPVIESRRRRRYKFSLHQVEMFVPRHFEKLLRGDGLCDGGHIGSVGIQEHCVNSRVLPASAREVKKCEWSR